jgi:hypothetical protein
LQTGKVTKEEISGFLGANGVQVQEVTLGGAGATFKNMSRAEMAQAYERIVGYDPLEEDPDMTDEELRETLEGYAQESGESDGITEDGRPMPKYSQYTLPGGENYREVLLTLPEKSVAKPEPIYKKGGDILAKQALFVDGGFSAEAVQAAASFFDEGGSLSRAIAIQDAKVARGYGYTSAEKEAGQILRAIWSGARKAETEAISKSSKFNYKSSHWDQPNVLAHIRVNDRTDADGKRVLFVEEVQADKGQEWQKLKTKIANGTATDADRARFEFLDKNFPFNATDKWLNLALKRIIKMAVDGGYDKVAFVNGEQSAERYDLSKQVDSITARVIDGGKFVIYANTGGEQAFQKVSTRDELPDLIGKDLAEKIIRDYGVHPFGQGEFNKTYRGLDLKVGGEGMKTFYDKIVPNATNALLKKLGGGKVEGVRILIAGGKVGIDGMRSGAKRVDQPGFTITPDMKEKASGGLPLFRRTEVSKAITSQDHQRRAMVESAAKEATANWANPPKIEYFSSLQDGNIPELVRAEDARQRKGGASGDIEGFYLGGTMYLWDGLKTPADVARVAFHEGLGHYGLRGVFGKALKSELEQIVALRKADVLAKAKQYGFDTQDQSALLKAAEEVLAEMAQNTPNIGFVKRAVAAIRTWLRQNVPGMANLQLSDAEVIRDYILPARAFVESGAGRDVAGNAAMSRQSTALNIIKAGDSVDGRIVRKDVPNKSSIGASLDDYTILDGLREVPMSDFDAEYISGVSMDRLDKRTHSLAKQISESSEISPLIVAYDSKGAYVIEGGHRLDALAALGAKSLPAMVVIDESDPPNIQMSRSPAMRATTIANDKPLTEKQFNSQYMQHILRPGADTEAILRDGFSSGIGPNLMSPYHGREPSNVMERKYHPRAGDTVLLVPKGAWRDTTNGPKIVTGWKPLPREVITVKYDKPNMYQEYVKAFGDTANPDIRFSRSKPTSQNADSSGDPSAQEAQQVHDGLLGKSLVEVAQWLSQNAPSQDQRLIAKRAMQAIQRHEANGFKFSFRIADVGEKVSDALANTASGETWFDGASTISVTLNGPGVTRRVGTSYETALHEVVHAATIAAIEAGSKPENSTTEAAKLYRDIRDLKDSLREQINMRKMVAPETLTDFEQRMVRRKNNVLENEHEVLTWALTNKTAQQWMEGIESDRGTLWSKFVNSIRKFLGLDPNKSSALSEALRLGEMAMETSVFPLRYPDHSNAYVNRRGDQRVLNKVDGAEGFTPPEQGLLRRLQAQFQDNNNRIHEIQKKVVAIKGEHLPEHADYYRAETNRPGRIAAQLQDFRENERSPLVERIAKSGHTFEQVEDVAHALHAQERNENRGRIHPDDTEFFQAIDDHSIVGASGMSTQKANEILEKYKSDSTIKQHAKDLQKIARAALDIKLASGQITRESYDAYVSAYENYVPLKGDGEYGPKVKSAIGHGERDEHIIENVMRDYELAVVSAERNIARQSFLQFVLENPDSELYTVNVLPKGRYIAGKSYDVFKSGEKVASFDTAVQAQAWIDGRTDSPNTYIIDIAVGKFTVEKNGKPVAYFDKHSKAEHYIESIKDPVGKFEVKPTDQTVREFVKPLQDNELPVFVNGQMVRIQMKDETLAKQMRPLNQEQMGWILEKFRALNHFLSRIYTAYSPTFLITNPLRDAGTGTISMIGNQGAALAAKAWTKYPSAFKALAKYAATGKEPDTDAGRMLKEYRMSGGKTGASHMSDLEEQGKTLNRLFEDAYGASGYLADGKTGKAALVAGRKILTSMAHVVEVGNQATENALRLSLYMTLRQNGSTASEAAQAAKNVTVNFDRKGNQTAVMSALYLFFNPAVQGTANAIRTLVKGKHKEQAWVAVGALAALGMYAAAQGIDDDEDRWLGEGWENRSKKLVMNIGGNRITVPMSLEYAPFYGFGVAMEEARRGKTKPMEAAGHMISSFLEAYVPFRGFFRSDSDNKALDLATSVVPTALRPSVEAATNRNSFGSKIVPENEFTKDRPDNLKMNRATKGTAYDAAAQGIAAAGEMAGAGRYENDITKVSPETLKHWWRTYTGGLGSFLGDTVSLAKIAAESPGSIELADVPVAKAFAKGQDVGPIRGRYYDLTKEARAVAEEFKQAKKAGDADAMADIESKPNKAELLGLDRVITKTTKAAAAIRDEMVDINAEKSLSLAEKRAKLKELEREEESIYRDAIAAFK